MHLGKQKTKNAPLFRVRVVNWGRLSSLTHT